MSRRDPAGGLALGARLRRSLARERIASVEQLTDIHAMPFEERVDSGHCIDGLRFLGWEKDHSTLRLACPVNMSRFRTGDRLVLGEGGDPGAGLSVVYQNYDPVSGELRLQKDSWLGSSEDWQALDLRRPLAVDRAHSDFGETVRDAVERVFAGDDERYRRVRAILERTAPRVEDPEARRRGEEAGAAFDLDPSQREALARSVSVSPVHLVQGPPGSGKTRVIASLLAALARRGHRALITAYTHRAVNQALRSLAAIDPSIRTVKVGELHHADDLPARVERVRSAKSVSLLAGPARGNPSGGAVKGALSGQGPATHGRGVPGGSGEQIVVGATVFALRAFWELAPFGWVILDEAAQMPCAHSLCALLSGRRYVMFGDPMQLGPILSGEHRDPLAGTSIFSHLAERAEGERGASLVTPVTAGSSLDRRTDRPRIEGRMGSLRHDLESRRAQELPIHLAAAELGPAPPAVPTLLRYTYRMNAEIASFPSRHFYGGALEPAPAAATRRLAFAPGGPLDEIWDPGRPALVVSLAHEGCRTRSEAEADLAADLLADFLVRQGRSASDIAVVTPYRAQVREIRNRLARRMAGGGIGSSTGESLGSRQALKTGLTADFTVKSRSSDEAPVTDASQRSQVGASGKLSDTLEPMQGGEEIPRIDTVERIPGGVATPIIDASERMPGGTATPIIDASERMPGGAATPIIDTVERMQGQERDVIIVSLACSEPDYAAAEADFFFSPNRLNVTLTRARTKLIVIASPHLFEALPSTLEGLKGASLFARLYEELPRIDLTDRYVRGPHSAAPS